MQSYLPIVQVIISVLMIIFILLQSKGSALGGVFGGESNVFKTKRGVEKFLHWGTVVLAVLFLAVAITNLLVQV